MPIIPHLIGRSVNCPECKGQFIMAAESAPLRPLPEITQPPYRARPPARSASEGIRIGLRIAMLIATVLWLGVLVFSYSVATQANQNIPDGATPITILIQMACPTVIYFVVVGVLLVVHFSIGSGRS